ncbi:MAG TPA: hypothetical protein VGK52_18775, partial [Polyangia bacterium]
MKWPLALMVGLAACGGSPQNASDGGSAGAGAIPADGGRAGAAAIPADGGRAGAGASDAAKDVALEPAKGTPGVWENVTSPEMPASLFTGAGGFGVGNIVVDPARPSDLYVGGYGSIWKSIDYGKTWTKLDAKPNPPYLPLGHVFAVAGTAPATLWMASVNGDMKVYKSTDGGLTFKLTGALSAKYDSSFYSIVVDPHDAKHLITGFH